MSNDNLIGPDDKVLVTGAAGFIGSRVVAALLARGFRNLRCFVRQSSDVACIDTLKTGHEGGMHIEIIKGNLLSPEDCETAVKETAVIYHLAAGRGEKSFPDAYLNSVVTTRNLLDAVQAQRCLKRLVAVSSFSVYSNRSKLNGRLLDESCPVDDRSQLRGDAYTYAKVKQDELLLQYAQRCGIPYVIIRPGVVYGPGNEQIHGRVGIGSFGLFLHTGGPNTIPLTYVDNCADAIVLAGLKPGINGEVFNVVDDDLPSSREFLALYKRNVVDFKSVYIPHIVSYFLCWLWEKYSTWSQGQLPPVFNRRTWHAYWKKTTYSNAKLKGRLGWTPTISATEALHRYFDSCRQKLSRA